MQIATDQLGRLQAWLAAVQRPGGLWPRALEAAALLGVFVLAVVVRVVSLGSVPRVITGDEANNLNTAYSIIAGTGPGPFGFDWNPSPILGLYPLAWTIRVFGNSVSDFRMYAVIFSLLTILMFYALARESMGALPALAGTALLSTNLWFLNFSRTAWENITAAFFAIAACWAATRALKAERGWWVWWVAVGMCLAGGSYGYFAGRLLCVPVVLIAAVGAATGQAPWRRAAAGLAIAAVLGAALFSPMFPKIVRDWHQFNTRTDTVSVFRGKGPFDRGAWETVRASLGRNYRGLILQDGSEVTRGLWGRYGPAKRAPLDLVATHLFWAGLVVSALRWRKTYTWWPFFVPLFIVEIFSRGTPDLARAVFFAPFYFLFIGMFFEEALRWRSALPVKAVLIALVVAAVSFLAISEVRAYFRWQRETPTQVLRLPGVDQCEFPLYQDLARQAAEAGVLWDPAVFDQQRAQLNCSPFAQGSQ